MAGVSAFSKHRMIFLIYKPNFSALVFIYVIVHATRKEYLWLKSNSEAEHSPSLMCSSDKRKKEENTISILGEKKVVLVQQRKNRSQANKPWHQSGTLTVLLNKHIIMKPLPSFFGAFTQMLF